MEEEDTDLSDNPPIIELKIKQEEVLSLNEEIQIKQEELDLDPDECSNGSPVIQDIFVKQEPIQEETEPCDDLSENLVIDGFLERAEPSAESNQRTSTDGHDVESENVHDDGGHDGVAEGVLDGAPDGGHDGATGDGHDRAAEGGHDGENESGDPGKPRITLSIDIYQDQLVNQRLGMGLRRRERGLLVSSVETGGTADAHGIKLGDTITEVENIAAKLIGHNFILQTLTAEGHLSLVIERESGLLLHQEDVDKEDSDKTRPSVTEETKGLEDVVRRAGKRKPDTASISPSSKRGRHRKKTIVDPNLLDNFPLLAKMPKVDLRILNDKKYKHILEELIEEEKTNLETAKILKAIKRSKQESSKVIDLCDKNVIDSEDSSSEDDFEEDLRRRGPPSKQSKPFPNLSSNMDKTRKTLRMKKKTGSKPKSVSQPSSGVTCGMCSQKFKSFLELGYHKIRCTGKIPKTLPVKPMQKTQEELSRELKGGKEPTLLEKGATFKEMQESHHILLERNRSMFQTISTLKKRIEENDVKNKEKLVNMRSKHEEEKGKFQSEIMRQKASLAESKKMMDRFAANAGKESSKVIALKTKYTHDLEEAKKQIKHAFESEIEMEAKKKQLLLNQTEEQRSAIAALTRKVGELKVKAKARDQSDANKKEISDKMIADYNKLKRLFIYFRNLIRVHFVPFTDKGVLILKKLESLKFPRVASALKPAGPLLIQAQSKGKQSKQKDIVPGSTSLITSGGKQEDGKQEEGGNQDEPVVMVNGKYVAVTQKSREEHQVEDQDPCELELKLQIEHAITSLDKENEIIVDTIDEKDSELIIEEDVERPLKIPEEGKADEVPSRDHTSNLSVPAPVSTSQGDAGCSQEAESSQSDITAPLKTKDRSPDIEIVDEKTEKDSCFEESLNLIRLMEDRLANKHCERMENKEGAPAEEGTEMISTSLKKSLFSAIKKFSDENGNLKKLNQHYIKAYSSARTQLQQTVESVPENEAVATSSRQRSETSPSASAVWSSSRTPSTDTGGSSMTPACNHAPAAHPKFRTIPAFKKNTPSLTVSQKSDPPPLVPILSTGEVALNHAEQRELQPRDPHSNYVPKAKFEALQKNFLIEKQHFLTLSGQYQSLRKLSDEMVKELEEVRRQNNSPEDERKTSIIKSQVDMIKMLRKLNEGLVDKNTELRTSGTNSTSSSVGQQEMMQSLISKVTAMKSILANIDIVCFQTKHRDYKRLTSSPTLGWRIKSQMGLVHLKLLREDAKHLLESRQSEIRVTEVCEEVLNTIRWKDKVARLYEKELQSYITQDPDTQGDGSLNAPIEISDFGERPTIGDLDPRPGQLSILSDLANSVGPFPKEGQSKQNNSAVEATRLTANINDDFESNGGHLVVDDAEDDVVLLD